MVVVDQCEVNSFYQLSIKSKWKLLSNVKLCLKLSSHNCLKPVFIVAVFRSKSAGLVAILKEEYTQDIYSLFSRSNTASRSCTSLVTVGPTKV